MKSVKGNVPDIDYNDFRMALTLTSDIASEFISLKNTVNEETIKEIINNHMSESDINRKIQISKDSLMEQENKLEKMKTQLSAITAKNQIYSSISGFHCDNASCPFEKKMEILVVSDEILKKKEEEIISFTSLIESKKQILSEWTSGKKILLSTLQYQKKLLPCKELLEKIGKFDLLSNNEKFFGLLLLPEFEIRELFDLSVLSEGIRIFSHLKSKNAQLASASSRIKEINNLVETQETIKVNIQKFEEEEQSLASLTEDLDKNILLAEKTLRAFQSASQIVKSIKTSLITKNKANEKLVLLESANSFLITLEKEKSNFNSEKVLLENDITNLKLSEESLSKEWKTIVLEKERRIEFEKRLSDLDNKKSITERINYTCHPTRGAPVYFLRDFLETTKTLANEMLDLALGGEFRIGFELSGNEFRIPIYKGSGITISDISAGPSGGEEQLTKVVLSLALVKQTITGNQFNILALDETDSELDREKNRERFVTIIDKLIADLGIEQVFIISHNDYFHATSAGVILLPGHSMPVNNKSFNGNKVIVGDFS